MYSGQNLGGEGEREYQYGVKLTGLRGTLTLDTDDDINEDHMG